jgi:hypothetical protein
MTRRRRTRPILPALIAVACVALAMPAFASESMVSCQLPPQIRRLDRNTPFLAPGRIVTTSEADCRQRGGTAQRREPARSIPLVAREGELAVMVGGQRDRPACARVGEIAGLRAGSTLSVRSGPGTSFARLDGLGNGRRVFVCDGAGDDAWLGVVYPRTPGQDCGLDHRISTAQPYLGPCASGWVGAAWVRAESASR